jgi:hypothetical protein
MKHSTSLIFIFLFLAVKGFTAEPLTIAVFDFAPSDDATRELAPKIAPLINATFSGDERVIPVERART